MKKIIKNKVSLTLNPQKNERTLSSNPQTKHPITNSAFSLRTSNIIVTHKEQKPINVNKYLICNTSPNNKITKHLNLTRTLQTITRSSHSKEGILSNKLVHKNNVLSNINSNINYINTNNPRHTVSVSNNNSITIHQRNNLSLTENAKRGKYQRISIKTNDITNNTNNTQTKYIHNINTNINNNISSPTNKNYFYANLNKVRISHKAYGIIEAYATITSSGKRTYNEDRVSIIYNIPKPQGYNENKNTPWPNCSFFGLYDGHGGSAACDFLRDNLHKYIINDKYFPSNPQKAIANGFIYAEKIFFKNYTGLDASGSCAIVVLIIENRVYIANVGDSRAILSAKNGTKIYPLSRDHRPGDEKEYKRILEAGGKIYKTEYEYGNNNTNSNTNNKNDKINNIILNKYGNNNSNNNNRQNNINNKINININNNIKSPIITNKVTTNYINSRYSHNASNSINLNNTNTNNRVISPNSNINQNKISSYYSTPNNTNKTITINNNIKSSSVMGPLRVSPGKLSVSRTIGDIAAKDPRYGGNPNVIISIPEIKYFDNSDKNDFILMFCDGVYEKLKNKDIIDCIWKEINKKKFPDVHNMMGYSIEKLVSKCLEQNSTDNLTVIMICLKNYDKLKTYEAPIPQTENIEQVKTKKLNITANLRQKSQSKKPLSMLLTKMIHNNSQNIKKIINLKNIDDKDNTKDISKDRNRKNENK